MPTEARAQARVGRLTVNPKRRHRAKGPLIVAGSPAPGGSPCRATTSMRKVGHSNPVRPGRLRGRQRERLCERRTSLPPTSSSQIRTRFGCIDTIGLAQRKRNGLRPASTSIDAQFENAGCPRSGGPPGYIRRSRRWHEGLRFGGALRPGDEYGDITWLTAGIADNACGETEPACL